MSEFSQLSRLRADLRVKAGSVIACELVIRSTTLKRPRKIHNQIRNLQLVIVKQSVYGIPRENEWVNLPWSEANCPNVNDNRAKFNNLRLSI